METSELFIPLFKQSAVEERLAQFAKKAKKYGFQAPVIEYGDRYFDRVFINPHQSVMVEFIRAKLHFERIAAPGGWYFGALVEKTEAANLISGPATSQFAHLRTGELQCDHCKTVRNRKKHYALLNSNGAKMVLGSSCVRDYFGHEPFAAIWSMQFLNWLHDPEELRDYSPTDEFIAVELKYVAALTITFIRRIGFISAQQGKEDFRSCPTWQEVTHQLFGKRIKPEDKVEPTDEERQLSQKVITRWEAIAKLIESDLEAANEWDYKKFLFVRNGWITPQARQMAIVVGMIAREYKQMAEETERQASGEPEFFGTSGKREEFQLTITRIQIVSGGFYGDKEMIAGVLSGTPHRFVWWNSGEFGKFTEGEITVKATIKEHARSDRYGKQTVLSRVTLI